MKKPWVSRPQLVSRGISAQGSSHGPGLSVPLGGGVCVGWRQLVPSVAVFLLGTALALALLFISRGWETEKSLDLFNIEGSRQLRGLVRGVDSFRPDNEAVLSFMQLTPNATYAQFQHFAEQQLASSPREGAWQALSYLPATPNERRAEFERTVCIEFCEVTGRNFSTMFIRNTTQQPEILKARYFGVYYIYPLETNLGAILFDISSNAARNVTINAAIETSEMRATPRITLVQELESGGGSYGILIIRPIWRLKNVVESGRPSLEPSVGQDLQGLTSGVVRVQELFEVVTTDTRTPSMTAFLFDASGPVCGSCDPAEVVRGRCQGCKPDYLHGVKFDSNSSMEWSRGYKVVDEQPTPWYTTEKVTVLMDTSSLQFVSTFDVFGRSWIFAMVGEESEWTEALTQWLLFAVVMVATFFVTALMLSSARQNAINVSLQEQDIARLKVITKQQYKDRIIAAAAEVRDLLKGMTDQRYPDGSMRKSHKAKPSQQKALLQASPGLSVVCLMLANADEISKAASEVVLRTVQQVIWEAVQELLHKNYGLDVTNSDSPGIIMAAFQSTMDACAFMTQLLSQLSGLEWAEEVLQLPQCAQVTNDHGLVKQRGPRVKACIHWASAEENLWVENAAGTSQFSGPARQISYSLAKAAMGGQVLMTEAASREQLGRSEDSDFTYMRPLGYYETGPSVVLITQLEPPTWDFGKAGFSTPGFVNGLNWVREPPRSLVGPPGLKPIPELEPSNGDSNTGNAGVVQLSLVTMSFPTLKGKVPKRMADTISALLEGLAQTYCGYVTPLEVSSLDSRQVLFMSALNSVRFCAGLQVALVHVPWEIEDEIFCGDEQLTVNGKPIFRGPRVAMVIASLPAGSFKWHSVAERTKSRRPLTAIEVQFQAPEVADSGNSASVGFSFDESRPYLTVAGNISAMAINGKGVTDANQVLKHVRPGQVIMTGPSWEAMLKKMPDETRPLDLGTYKLISSEPAMKLIEVQIRQLQNRKFPALPSALQEEAGFMDAPDGEDGIAYLMCQVKDPSDVGSPSSEVFLSAIKQWNDLVRSMLKTLGGYECQYTEPGGFNLAFSTMIQALRFAVVAQKRAMDIKYSKELLKLNGCAEVFDEHGNPIFKGIRIKMGLSFGPTQGKQPSSTGRANYTGPFFNVCAASVLVASPGQIVMEPEATMYENEVLKNFELDEPGNQKIGLEELGFFHLKGVNNAVRLVSAYHPDHKGRMFSSPPGRVVEAGSDIPRGMQGLIGATTQSTATMAASVSKSLAGVMQELMVDRIGWSEQKFRSDEQVDIQGIIGVGNFGKVYKGLWKGVTVAYKVIQYPADSIGEQEQCTTTAIMETAISASMSHPNVVQTYSYNIKPIMAEESSTADDQANAWESDEKANAKTFKRNSSVAKPQAQVEARNIVLMWEVQIIQEYCSLGSLRKVLDDGKHMNAATGFTDLDFTLSMTGDIARGMLHIHSRQIVHGDLKAHNILIATVNGVTAKVADFGLSIKMDKGQTHVSGVHAGTLTHMAPEILMSGRISKAADVYAFGILMYETLTGQKAFKGTPMHMLAANVCNKKIRPQFPPGAPEKFVHLAKRCWEHHPEKRPSFIEIVSWIDDIKRSQTSGQGNTPTSPFAAAPSNMDSIIIPEELTGSYFVVESMRRESSPLIPQTLHPTATREEPSELSGSFYMDGM